MAKVSTEPMSCQQDVRLETVKHGGDPREAQDEFARGGKDDAAPAPAGLAKYPSPA
jgi:hypothetical protein